MLPALGTQTSMYKKEEDKTQNLENDYVTSSKITVFLCKYEGSYTYIEVPLCLSLQSLEHLISVVFISCKSLKW